MELDDDAALEVLEVDGGGGDVLDFLYSEEATVTTLSVVTYLHGIRLSAAMPDCILHGFGRTELGARRGASATRSLLPLPGDAGAKRLDAHSAALSLNRLRDLHGLVFCDGNQLRSARCFRATSRLDLFTNVGLLQVPIRITSCLRLLPAFDRRYAAVELLLPLVPLVPFLLLRRSCSNCCWEARAWDADREIADGVLLSQVSGQNALCEFLRDHVPDCLLEMLHNRQQRFVGGVWIASQLRCDAEGSLHVRR